ncbi:hypothetical protein [Defluviimonas salinarum]|uniref:Uncharacterized protein n=1 Tax=Defluviimonas salinarum TaxID=2992147 RepID=A0ABT3J5K6_9RHOB|nr:hypothetical protein [Defluviimonas salinarum]MCW3782972.1 hypothetical protein [Defluviimonas salinarum]
MGNLVSNRVTISSGSGGLAEARLEEILALLTGLEPGEARRRLEEGEPGYGAWLPFAFGGVTPEPQSLAATGETEGQELGLAILSGPDSDYIRLLAGMDPFEDLMPPEMARTRAAILKRHGLDGLQDADLLAEGEARFPEAIEAGRIAIRAYEETGHFNWLPWREKHWGTRCDAEEGLFRLDAEGALSVRFDTVNDVPIPFLKALAARFPALMLDGAGFDEDTETSVFFATEEPGLLVVAEEDDRDGVERAHEIVYGHRPENDNEPDEDEPDEGDEFEL